MACCDGDWHNHHQHGGSSDTECRGTVNSFVNSAVISNGGGVGGGGVGDVGGGGGGGSGHLNPCAL